MPRSTVPHTKFQYRHEGATLYGIRNEVTGRVYGPYWLESHADLFIKNCLTECSPRARVFGNGVVRFAVAVALTAVVVAALGVDWHAYLSMLCAGLFFSIVL